jgi:RNA recognition motif-containing protein
MAHQGFGFCEFLSEEDADYAVKIMNQIKLYGKPIRVNKASYDTKKPVDVGANLFIGSLDEGVDENALYDTFSTFGSIAEHPKVSRGTMSTPHSGHRCVIGVWKRACAHGRSHGTRQRASRRDTDSSHTTTLRRLIWLSRT